jgi:hypothetical protein
LALDGKEGGKEELVCESYDVVEGVYPSETRLKEADAVLITGSGEYFVSTKPQLELTRDDDESIIFLPPHIVDHRSRNLHLLHPEPRSISQDIWDLFRASDPREGVWEYGGEELEGVGDRSEVCRVVTSG